MQWIHYCSGAFLKSLYYFYVSLLNATSLNLFPEYQPEHFAPYFEVLFLKVTYYRKSYLKSGVSLTNGGFNWHILLYLSFSAIRRCSGHGERSRAFYKRRDACVFYNSVWQEGDRLLIRCQKMMTLSNSTRPQNLWNHAITQVGPGQKSSVIMIPHFLKISFIIVRATSNNKRAFYTMTLPAKSTTIFNILMFF